MTGAANSDADFAERASLIVEGWVAAIETDLPSAAHGLNELVAQLAAAHAFARLVERGLRRTPGIDDERMRPILDSCRRFAEVQFP